MVFPKWIFVQVIILLYFVSKGIKGQLLADEHHDNNSHDRLYNRNSRSLSILRHVSVNDNAKDQPIKRCGHKDPTTDQMKKDSEIVKAWIDYENKLGRDDVPDFIEVPTYFHIITNGSNGNHRDEQILDQLDVLNSGFKNSGFQFSIAEITRTDNKDWYTAGRSSTFNLQMKAALRQGDASVLNVFIVGRTDALGWSSLISMYNDYPDFDGVVIYGQTMPGGTLRNYNLGHTLTHEVGHWVGLYHTFQSSEQCKGNGDFVDDTPFQRNFTTGCPRRKNTCRLRRGRDPIHNFMDYSYDRCYTEFTSGQHTRMKALWTAYREGGKGFTCSIYKTVDDCLSGFCFWDVDNSNCVSYNYR